MILSLFTIPVAEGREEEFAESFRRRKSLVDTMHGFISLDVLAPTEGNEHIVMTRWESMEDFEAWTRSEEFAAAHRKGHPGMTSGPPSIKFYEVLTSSHKK